MSPLPPVRRVVTTHDATGASAFLHDGPAPTTLMIPALGDLSPVFSHVWTTASLPVDNQDDTDWAQAATEGKTVRPGGGRMDFPGLGCLVVDMAPGGQSPMHRTPTYDIGVVVEGEVWLELDGGESRLLKKGDVVAQRGANHKWHNKSPTEWARTYFFMTNSLPITGADGKAL